MSTGEVLGLGFMRESEALSAGFIKNNKVYSDSDETNLDFPIGTVVAAYFGDVLKPNLNSSKAIGIRINYLYAFYSTDISEVIPLSGVWRSRGMSGATSTNKYVYIYQRTQ